MLSAKKINYCIQLVFVFLSLFLFKLLNIWGFVTYLIIVSSINVLLVNWIVNRFQKTSALLKEDEPFVNPSFLEVKWLYNEISEKMAVCELDHLTGVYNRKKFDGDLVRCHNEYISLLMIDLDHFKEVNDTFGHLTGDKILTETGELLKDVVGDNGAIYRYGGEEFVVILQDVESKKARIIAEGIREAFKGAHFTKGPKITVSIGLASGKEPMKLLEQADRSMYFAKLQGRDCISCI